MSLTDEVRWPAAHTPTGFVLRLAKALHTYGTPAYELERIINNVAKHLGFGLECFSLPTMITLSLFEPDKHSSFVIRVSPGDINLEKLAGANRVAKRVLHGDVSLEEAAKELLEVTRAPPRWGASAVVASFGLVSLGVARVFSGDAAECISSSLIGIIVGLLAVFSTRNVVTGYLFPTIAAFLATVMSYILADLTGHASVYITLVSGLIVLLPGLTITVGLGELATQNLVSGTARLSGAAILFVLMGFGIAVGDLLGEHWYPQLTEAAGHQLPAWTEWAGVMIAGVGFVALFQSRLRDAIWVLLAGLIAYSSSRYGSALGGPIAGAFVGAFTIGAASHIFRFIMLRPNSIMLVPGIILLVPGSVGFKSLHALLEKDVVAGLDIAFQMMLAGISLVVGLLLSSIFALPERRDQKGENDEVHP